MDFLFQHQESFLTFIGTVMIGLLPFVNRFLDKLTSNRIVEDLFWLISQLEDGKLTEEELDETVKKIKKYLN